MLNDPTTLSTWPERRSYTPFPRPLPRLYFLPHLPPRLPRIVDRPFVFDGGDIAGIPVEDNGFEHAPHDFSAPGFRQHRHKVQLADDGHRTKLPADGFEE